MTETTCPLCGKVCKNKLGYNSHLRSHTKKGEIVPGAPVRKGSVGRPKEEVALVVGQVVVVRKNGEKFVIHSVEGGKVGRKINAVDPIKLYSPEELTAYNGK